MRGPKAVKYGYDISRIMVLSFTAFLDETKKDNAG